MSHYARKMEMYCYLKDASGECFNMNLDNSFFTKSSLLFILALNTQQEIKY